MLYFERKFRKLGFTTIIGVDEAGRGPLAGPVVAAAVTLAKNSFKNRIDDSKKLTPLQRERAFCEICSHSSYGVGIVNERVIDSINILRASEIAMEKAVIELSGRLTRPAAHKIHLLIDGSMYLNVPYSATRIVRGDSRSQSIAAASIIAKVIRDRIMRIYHKVYPQYGFITNKGYPTRQHKHALRLCGPSVIHRKSFYCV